MEAWMEMGMGRPVKIMAHVQYLVLFLLKIMLV